MPAREVERLREEAAKPSFFHTVNTNIGYGIAGVGEAMRPTVSKNLVRLLRMGGIVSIGTTKTFFS